MYAFPYDFHTHSGFASFRDEPGDRHLHYEINVNTWLDPDVFSDADVYVFFSQIFFYAATSVYHLEYSNLRLDGNKVKMDLSVKDGVKLHSLSGHILIVGKNKARCT